MKVLHVLAQLDPRSGGPVIALAGLLKAQIDSGIQANVFTTYLSGDDNRLAEQFIEFGSEVNMVGPAWDRTIKYHPGISKAIRDSIEQSDVVHVHGVWEHVHHLAIKWAARLGVPAILRPCGMLDPWSLKQSALFKRMYMNLRTKGDLAKYSVIHFTTESEKHLARPLNLPGCAVVEPNGIETSEFQNLPPREVLDRDFPQLVGKDYVVFLSRLHSKKGLDLLVEAFAKLENRSLRLLIAGPDNSNYRGTLDKLIAGHNVRDRVVISPIIGGQLKLAALSHALFMVLPSYQENFGNVVLEALACGTPVMISDQVALHTFVRNESLGEICECNVESVRTCVERMLDNDSLEETGRRGRELVINQFSWSSIASRWKTHYTSLAAW